MKKRGFSILLCLILVVGLLPTTARAIPRREIASVSVSISAPVHGGTPAYTATREGDEQRYQVSPDTGSSFTNGIYWYDETASHLMRSGNSFVGGHQYSVHIKLVKTGEVDFTSDVSGKINGKTAEVEKYSDHIVISAALDCPAMPINTASVKLTAAAVGANPSFSATAGDAAYTVNEVKWYQVSSQNLSSVEKTLSASDRFEAGKTYVVSISLKPAEGYAFSGSVNESSVTLNGANPTFVRNKLQYGIEVQHAYALPAEGGALSSVALTVTAPAAGAAPSYSVSVTPSSMTVANRQMGANEYSENGVSWFDQNTGSYLKPSDTFQEGHVYKVSVGWLKPGAGEKLTTDSYGNLNATATVNGGSAELSGSSSNAIASYTFPALAASGAADKQIDSVSITVTPPTMGAKPVYSAAVGGAYYQVNTAWGADDTSNGVGWARMNSKQWDDIDKPLKSTDTVEEGKIYMVAVALKPDSGYSFAPGLVSDTSKVLVNGYAAAHAAKNGDGLIVYYVFPPAAPTAVKKLESIAITTPPVKTVYQAGETFDPKGMVVTATYTDKTTAVITGYTVNPSGKLTEGNKNVTISYTENYITQNAVQAITVHAAGAKVNPFADVKESDYFYNAVLWAYYADPQVTNGIDATHFGPSSTVTRGQAMTFLWRAAGCPEPKLASNPFEDVKASEYYFKPILWAVEQGITNGTDATHFSPNQTCTRAHIVTFLYRRAGSPGAAPNPNNEWYTDAMDWAYSIRLVQGTDQINIDPLEDCPRCDVVLYLYRQMAE